MPRVASIAAWATLAVGLVALPAWAQPREALGGAVVDVRVVSTTLPTAAGWAAPVTAAGALIPARGAGVDAGAHVFLGPGSRRRLSLGASGLLAEGRATGLDAPTVATRLVTAAPHVAINFGHRHGWSYLSSGVGTASVRSYERGQSEPAASWGMVIHYGAGARWFLREHVAVTLDLRFWALTPRPATPERSSAAATTRIALGAGLSFR